MQTEKAKEQERQKFIEEIIAETREDFLERQKQRLFLERQWELNVNFLNGNQYCEINSRGEIYQKNANDYYWQERGVFNHIAPIIETRLSKLSRLSTQLGVRPKTDDDTDVSGAKLAEKAIGALFDQVEFSEVVKKTSIWSESCGTGFYKITWDNFGGMDIGEINGKRVKEGEINIISVSPFEVFPDNIYKDRLEDCFSVIHARAVSVRDIKEKYGVEVDEEELFVSELRSVKSSRTKENSGLIKGSALVIEKYEKPSLEFPNGRLITIAGDKLLYYGELPYVNGKNKTRTFPFVKQESMKKGGSFFGQSVIERLIPVQRAYNAVKNRKHEFINRFSNGVMMVEDGSIDVEDLEQDGLPPGKILVYRQGSTKPQMMDGFSIPSEFNDEEQKLINEFVIISGVSDVSSSSRSNLLHSGTALELLVEQDNERLISSAEIVRNCFVEIGRQVIRLYAQFLSGVKMVRFKDETDKVHVFYLDNDAVNSDEVYLKTENQLKESEVKRKNMIIELYEKGLFNDNDGKVRDEIKEKLLSALGLTDFDYQKGLPRLQSEKANRENAIIRKRPLPIEEIDDDKIHVEQHTRYIFSEYDELSKEEKQRLLEHVKEHKLRIQEKEEK